MHFAYEVLKNFLALMEMYFMNIKTIIATMFLTFSTQAHSLDGWIDVHLTSYHSNSTYVDQSGNDVEYNQNNFGLGLSLPVNSNIDARAGFFKNSFNKTSGYLGADFHTNSNKFFSAGINTGLASGYKNTPAKTSTLTPMLVPYLSFKVNNFRTQIGYIPAIDPKQVAVWTISVGIKF